MPSQPTQFSQANSGQTFHISNMSGHVNIGRCKRTLTGPTDGKKESSQLN